MGNLLLWCTLPEQENGKTSASLTGLGVLDSGKSLTILNYLILWAFGVTDI